MDCVLFQIKMKTTLESSRRRSAGGFGYWIWNGLLRWQLAAALAACCKARRLRSRRKCQRCGYQMSSSGTVSRWTLNSWVGKHTTCSTDF